MIIFGFRTSVFQIAMLTFMCGRCGNPAAHAVRKAVRKFSLFFIPLFPVSTKYSLQCTYCGAASALTKEQVDGMLAAVAAPQPQAPAVDSPEQSGGQSF